MWKKDEMPTSTNPYAPEGERTFPPRPELSVSSPAPAPAATGERATIGRSITIRGDVTGNEDLLIQGRVDGSIDLKQHAVTIGSEGEVKASIAGRRVIVEGSVEGNIVSEEQVILRSSARVQGDITAPRLVLEDGARFRGGVDMGEAPETNRTSSGGATSTSSQAGKKSAPAATPPATETATPTAESGSEANGAKRKSGDVVAEARA